MTAGERGVMRENKKPPVCIEPCTIDGHSFATVKEAHQYLMEIDGRIHFDRLERGLRQGRRILGGHEIGVTGGVYDSFSSK